jgi:hypothetical protein
MITFMGGEKGSGYRSRGGKNGAVFITKIGAERGKRFPREPTAAAKRNAKPRLEVA